MKQGRPTLEPEQARRVRDALNEMLRTKFEGNASALARSLGIGQSGVSRLLSGATSASFVTAQRIANAIGVSVLDLLGQEAPKAIDAGTYGEMLADAIGGNLGPALHHVERQQAVSAATEMIAVILSKRLPDDLPTTAWIELMTEIDTVMNWIASEPKRLLAPPPPDQYEQIIRAGALAVARESVYRTMPVARESASEKPKP